ncbi:zinc-dependent metalloprotease [Coraliomargarita algicola]|uniref:Zinc-dependent metalloprotease n=1 Tax=Coraliomargarita algicola TaxID=3092156 RepID=A0ABZ0RCS6_9BACT|nr:zinc-dependent metalloprotease [Coraliomargarita sp. J2-16]WPJ93945.1 zinc-dependent metalloprotease [Coraliomargarita sp. J2-16]
MSARKSPSPLLILCTLAILIASALYLWVSRPDRFVENGHSPAVAGEAETTQSQDDAASPVAEQPPAVEAVPVAAAVAPAATPAPIVVRQQPEFDHYFKRVAAGGPLLLPEHTFDVFKGSSVGDRLTFDFDAVQFEGTVVGVREHPNASKYALNLDDGNGRIIYSLDANGKQVAQVAFNQDSRAFWISEYRELQHSAGLLVEQVTVSDLYCAPPGVVYPLSSPANIGKFSSSKSFSSTPVRSTTTTTATASTSAQPKLNSIPGAEFVLYCDFDGELVEDFDLFLDGEDLMTIYAAPHAKANDTSWVTAVWQRVAEDFAPFDITVTTDRAVYDAADVDKRLLVVITPDDTAAPGAGGVAAEIGYFRTNNPVCWVFNEDEYSCAATISHEAGHVFGLSHDGRTGDDEYYGGHNTDYSPGWAPIMGAPWSDDGSTYLIDEVYQWSRGEYLNANNQEDDLAIIASESNGFGYKADDIANSYDSDTLPLGTITTLADNNISGSGLISRTSDVDVFSFVTASGELDITVAPLDVDSQEGETDSDKRGANLAVNTRLFNSVGALIATGVVSGDVGLSSNIKVTVPFGKYYLEVDGGGRGSGPSTGFSDYGSLGQYTISGTIATPPLAVYGGAKQLQSVLTGDTDINTSNGTDFGFTQPSAAAITHTFYLTNTSSFVLENLTMSLANNTVFDITSTIPDSIAVGATFPVNITYDAVSNRLDYDTVTISYTGEQSEVFTFTIGGTCTPKAYEDNYENGINLTGAPDLTAYEDVLLSDYKGLGWMTDYLDHYKFTVEPGDQFITVETFHDSDAGAIEFELYRLQGNQSILVAIMYGDAGSETLEYRIPDGVTSLNYFILVKPAEEGVSLKNTYDLKWSARSLGLADGDLYEDNDNSTEAFDITRAQSSQLSNILGTAILDDEDWYRLDIARDPFARFLYVLAEFDESMGNVQVELYNENLQLLSISEDQDDRAMISYYEIMSMDEVADEWDPEGNTAIQGVPPGTYYVRVTGDYSDDNVYDMFFGVLEDDVYEQVGLDEDNEVVENDQYSTPYDLGTSILGTSLSKVNGYGITASYAVNASVESFTHYNDGDFYKFTIGESGVTQVQVAFTGLGVSSDYLTYRLTKTDGTFVDTFTTDADSPANATYVLTIDDPAESEYLIYVEAAEDIGYLTAYDFTVTLVKGTTLIDGAVEDNYEQNDNWQQRFNISGNAGSWLTSINGYGALFDRDWYQIRVPTGATKLEVIARSDSSLGNLDLYVYSANGGILLKESTTGGDTETISWDNPLAGDLSVVILGDYVGNRYNLFWDVTFAEDNYEQNDTRQTSFDLIGHERRLLSKLNGYGIQKDEDWYEISADVNTAELRVLANFTHAEGDIDMEIYNESGAILQRATSSDDDETLILSNPPAGSYYVRVHYGNEGNKYNLSWAALSAEEVAQINLGEDAYEENDSLGEAYQLTAADSRLSNLEGLANQTDDDWYSITVGDENFGLYVECLFDDAEGDIDLEIYDDFGTPIIRRDSVTDNEIVDLQAAIPGGVYYIRVYGPNLGNSYDLYFIARTEDAYEENDTRATAYDITALTSPLSEFEVPTQSDDDWYKINVTGEHPFIEVTLDYIELNGSIDFSIMDAAGNEIVNANSMDDSESVFVEVEPGVNYIYVYGDDEYNTYDISWAFYEDDEYEDNDVSADATDITDTPVINAVQYDTDWYQFEVTEDNSFITVIATYAYEDGNIDVALYRSEDLDNPLQVSATTGNSAGVRIESGPGIYYVEVTGDNTNGDYQLLWTTAPDDDYEDNDVREEATDLTELEGTVIDAVQYDEDWYEVLVQPGNVSLTAELGYSQADGNLILTLYDAAGVEVATADTTEDDETLAYGVDPFEPEELTYYIKVSGVSLGTAYQLSWVTSTEDAFEGETGNNTYEDASDVLLGSEGQRISETIGYGGALDEDWYEVRINSGDEGIVIEAYFEHSDETNIDLELFNASKGFLKRSIGTSNVERLHYEGAEGTYYLRVFGKNGGQPYDLVWNSYHEDNLEKAAEGDFEVKETTPDNDSPDTPRGLLLTKYNSNFYAAMGGGDYPDLEYFLLDDLTQLDEDWYSVVVNPGEDIFIVDLQFEHALGDIDVAVYKREVTDPLDSENVLEAASLVAQSEEFTDGERIVLHDLEPGEYLICVYGYGIVNPKESAGWTFDPYTDDLADLADYESIREDGTDDYYDLAEDNARGLGNTYSLQWVSASEDTYDAEPPALDSDEEQDPSVNDTQSMAAIPALLDQQGVEDTAVSDPDVRRTYTATNDSGEEVTVEYRPVYRYYDLAQFDEDWYEVPVDTGGDHQFFATIYFNNLHGDLDLYLYAENGDLVDSSVREGSFAESVEASGDGLTKYYLRVVGNDLGVPYTLEMRGYFDDDYEDNETIAEADVNADIENLNGVPISGLVSRDLDLYRIYVPANQVHLSFDVDSPGIAFNISVLDAAGVELPGGFEESGRSTAGNDNQSEGVIAPDGGIYYLQVTATSGLTYDLTWSYNNIDQYEADGPYWHSLLNNDTPEEATELTRLRLEPPYDPEDPGPLDPIKELAFDYGLLGSLTLGSPGLDPFGHAIQEDYDWYKIQIPSWFLTTAKKGNKSVTVLKRDYYVRLSAEIEFLHVDGDINIEIYDENDMDTPLARSETSNDIESVFARIDPTDEDRNYYIRVYGDNRANDYSLTWDVSKQDAYEELEDENVLNDTNNFVDLAYDLTTANGVSTEGIWLHEIEYLQDVNGDGDKNNDGGYTSAAGYGMQTTDDWYAVVVSPGATQIAVDLEFFSDNDTGYTYAPDNLDMDFEVYFLAGNDGDSATADLRKPVPDWALDWGH